MRIVVNRTGGVAGLTRRWVVEVDEPERAGWILLVDACPWDDRPDDPPEPDRFFYVILADAREARLPEQRVEGPWRDLVDRVRSVGRTEPVPRRPTAPDGHSPGATGRQSAGDPHRYSPEE